MKMVIWQQLSLRRFSKFITHLEFFNMTSDLRGEILELGVFKGNSLFRWLKFRDLLGKYIL
jgi:hypothetical protein